MHSREAVRAATLYVYRMTLGSPRLLMALPPKIRSRCIAALAIVKQAAEHKGDDHDTHADESGNEKPQRRPVELNTRGVFAIGASESARDGYAETLISSASFRQRPVTLAGSRGGSGARLSHASPPRGTKQE